MEYIYFKYKRQALYILLEESKAILSLHFDCTIITYSHWIALLQKVQKHTSPSTHGESNWYYSAWYIATIVLTWYC